jgi:hypothetical protein
VPVDLVAALGRTEIWKSLGTTACAILLGKALRAAAWRR